MKREIPTEVKQFVAGLIEEIDGLPPRNEAQITPAAVSAAARGDWENFLVASTPGGIEMQEAQGQRDLCINSAKLPRDGAVQNRKQLEALGIVFGKDVDDLFVGVTLPQGWRIAPTEHSMWSDLLDVQGRKRAGVFYKAAFYDRRAHMHLNRRYSYGTRPVGGWEQERGQRAFEGYVSDFTGDLFVTSPTVMEPKFDREARELWDAWAKDKDAKSDEAEQWLVAHFPDWKNPLAYWE